MEWKDLLVQLIDTVQSASGVLWAIARRQAIVIGIQNLIGVVVAIIFFVISIWTIKKLIIISRKEIEKNHYVDEWWETNSVLPLVFCGCVAVCSIVATIGFLITGISMLTNPDFYAIKILIGLVTQ